MKTVSGREAGFWELLEAFQAVSAQLGRFKEVSQVADAAVKLALDLTRSSVAFIALTNGSGAREVFLHSATGSEVFDSAAIERLVASAASPSPLMISHPLNAGEHVLGVFGVAGPAGYTPAEQRAFSVFANQVASALEIAHLQERRKEIEERAQTVVERLEKVDAARQLLLKNVSTAVDKARRRLASQLHDDALQTLTAAELQLQRLRQSEGHDDVLLDGIQGLLTETEDALRGLLFEVRPPALETPGGLQETIRERVAMMIASTGIEAELNLDLPDEPSYEFKSMVFRQVAEALANIEKHAAATLVQLSVKSVDGAIHGLVVDNGRGFVVTERDHLPGHLGLLALNERSLLAGGWTRIESEPGIGTTVEFWMPMA